MSLVLCPYEKPWLAADSLADGTLFRAYRAIGPIAYWSIDLFFSVNPTTGLSMQLGRRGRKPCVVKYHPDEPKMLSISNRQEVARRLDAQGLGPIDLLDVRVSGWEGYCPRVDAEVVPPVLSEALPYWLPQASLVPLMVKSDDAARRLEQSTESLSLEQVLKKKN